MLNKRGLGKKGQEGMSLTTLGALLLVVLVVVLIILGVTGVLNPIFSKSNLIPGGGLSALITICNNYGQADYCAFRQVSVNGLTEYVSCADKRVQAGLSAKGAYDCSGGGPGAAERAECIALFKQGISNPIVSGVADSDIRCNAPTVSITTPSGPPVAPITSTSYIFAPITCVNDLGGVLSIAGGISTSTSCPPLQPGVGPSQPGAAPVSSVMPTYSAYTKPITNYNTDPTNAQENKGVCCIIPLS